MDFIRGMAAKNYPKVVSKLDSHRANLTKLERFFEGDGTKELDIAISAEGKAELLDALYDAIVVGTKQVLDADKELKLIIDYAWKGEDADTFIANFDKTKNEAMQRIEEHYNTLKARLDKVESEWEAFRSSHVSAE